jgi:hypothetical protein
MTYKWTTTNSAPLSYLSSTTTSNPTFSGVQKGTFKYRVTVTNVQTGCSAVDDVTVVVDKPEVSSNSFWAKLAIPLPLSTTATGGFGSNSFSWSPGNNLSDASVSNPTFTTSIEGEYNYAVNVTDLQGCTGTAQVYVNASSAPGNLAAKAESYFRINLIWEDRSDNETSFAIERSINGTDNFVEYGLVGPNITTFQDLNVDNNHTYYYRVKAVINGANSRFTNVASIATSTLPIFSSSGLSSELT